MDRIFQVLNTYRSHLLHLENVVGVGVGCKIVGGECTNTKAICVLVTKKQPVDELRQVMVVPKRLGDQATDVIEIGEVRLLSRTERERPARPGMSIGHYAITAGTFGCVVRDNRLGTHLILSNNHVLANMTNGRDGRAQVGDEIYQPGRHDGGTSSDVIARLLRWVPIHREIVTPSCAIAKSCETAANALIQLVKPAYQVYLVKRMQRDNLVDAAVAQPVSTDVVSQHIIDIGVPRGTAVPSLGMKLQKSGRTSGYSTGNVMVIGATIRVLMGDIGFASFSEQIVTSPMAEPGDSGSLMLDESTRAVGLLSAGSDKATIAGTIRNVESLLGVSMLTAH